MLERTLLVCLLSLCSLPSSADTIRVSNIDELNRANRMAKPGDLVILNNGNWNDVEIALTCKGTPDHPIIFKAESPGKVQVTGKSVLKISGSSIVVDGLYFVNGHSGKEAVISFRKGKDAQAENCRVTNCVVDGYNNENRLEENQWVALYGKKNRIDHCSFLNKKNLGVLMAVMLDDDRCRENYHTIEDNYFGVRIPLASNGGEIIRVGLSEHCQYNSYTRILGNSFEHCDGEAEIISIKSCGNIIRGNVFKECQGSVVLRHGDNNTVEDNIFIGNGKQGTGGVRVINRGQWVVNNYFYKCMGTGFRAPFCIMNGVPNSPPIRYVEVSDAVIANNTFFGCAPMSLCEGSDAERSIPPHDVSFINNVFYHPSESRIAELHDDISKIQFMGNAIGGSLLQNISGGFSKTNMNLTGVNGFMVPIPSDNAKYIVSDSLIHLSKSRISSSLSKRPGISDIKVLQNISSMVRKSTGATWFKPQETLGKSLKVECRTPDEFLHALEKGKGKVLIIQLTGDSYEFDSSITFVGNTVLSTDQKRPIRFSIKKSHSPFLFQIGAGHSLALKGLSIDLHYLSSNSFLSTDTSGKSNHSSLSIEGCTVRNMQGGFLHGARSSVLDSIIISGCQFNAIKGSVLQFISETDNKGYYNVEKMSVVSCVFSNCSGPILNILRSGKDESTLGPQVFFMRNQVKNCHSGTDSSLISLKGVQVSMIEGNTFTDSNTDKLLIEYQDWVKAAHVFRKNRLLKSGIVQTNAYVSLQ